MTNTGVGVSTVKGGGISWDSYWTPLKEPTNLVGIIINKTTIDITWNDPSVLSDGLQVFLSTDGINYVYNSTVTNGVSYKRITGLTEGLNYTIKVVSYKGSNLSVGVTVAMNNSFMAGILNQFRFDETEGATLVDDISGNNGTITGATINQVGKIGRCASFDGNDSIALTSAHTIALNESFTISLWIRPSAGGAVKYILYATVADNNRIYLYQDNTSLVFRYTGIGGGPQIIFEYAFPQYAHWTHVICERNVTTDKINLFVNGLAWGTAVTDNSTNACTTTLSIGNTFVGLIDELRIWERLLTATEKLNLYNYNRGNYGGRFDNGKLVISFDDSIDNIYTVGYPIFQAKNAKATIYNITNVINGEGKLTWNNLTEMQASGLIDNQCHSCNGDLFTGLSQAQILANLETVNTAYAANGLPVPYHTAYPGGANSLDIRNWITASGLRRSCRGVGGFQLVMPHYDKMYITSYGWDNLLDAGVITLKGYLDRAKHQKAALSFYGHGVTVDGSATTIKASRMEEIIDYAQLIGIDIIFQSELYDLMYK